MIKAMIVFNPDSGSGRSSQLADALNQKIRHKFETITMKETEKGSDVTAYAGRAAEEGYEALFVLGGDGTVNLAVNGLMGLEKVPAIGIVPTGTINNFARMLNIPVNPNQAIEAMANARVEHLDVGQFKDEYFVSTVSAGKIPESAREVSSEEKERMGPVAYIKEGLQALNDHETTRIRLTLDGEVVEEEFSLILATTGNSVFGWHNFFPNSTLKDGHINVMGLRQSERGEVIKLIPELLSDSDNYSDILFSGNYKTVIIEPMDEVTLKTTVDGNDGPDFPGEISVGGQLPFFVVDQAK